MVTRDDLEININNNFKHESLIGTVKYRDFNFDICYMDSVKTSSRQASLYGIKENFQVYVCESDYSNNILLLSLDECYEEILAYINYPEYRKNYK